MMSILTITSLVQYSFLVFFKGEICSGVDKTEPIGGRFFGMNDTFQQQLSALTDMMMMSG